MAVEKSLIDLLLDRLEATASRECSADGLNLEQAVLVAKLVKHVEHLIKLLNEVCSRVRFHDLIELINLNLDNGHFALIIRIVFLALLDFIADNSRYENVENLLEFEVGSYFPVAINELFLLFELLYIHIG